jgi:RNA polymerase sigma-B factor
VFVSTETSTRPQGASLQRLFHRYHRHTDLEARDALIRRFQPLAVRLARRYRTPGGEPLEDLVQVAMVGLIKAIDRFDPTRGFAFVSFAEPTITGELRRWFRDATWAVHMPRQLQEDILLVEGAAAEISARQGEAPTVRQLVEKTGLEPERVLEALQASRSAKPKSLDAPVAGDPDEDATLAERHGGEDGGFDLVEYGVAAAPALAELSERDRRILHLRFVEDLTQSEIAAQVGISQMQVSRVLAKALQKLRAAANDELPLPALPR